MDEDIKTLTLILFIGISAVSVLIVVIVAVTIECNTTSAFGKLIVSLLYSSICSQ